MPDLRPDRPTPLALLTGDWQLCDQPPRARAESRSEWYELQEWHLGRLETLRQKLGSLVIFIAGDLFDRSDSSSELVNFVIRNMPKSCYGVAGNHDLTNHSYKDIRNTSYWTLVEAGALRHLGYESLHRAGARTMNVFGLSHGREVCSFPTPAESGLNLLVAHRYVWAENLNPAMRNDGYAENILREFASFQVVHTGDNHQTFQYRLKTPAWDCEHWLFNAGTLIRRHKNEIDYNPAVGVLYSDGTVVKHYLGNKDRFRDVPDDEKVEEVGLDAAELVEELRRLGDVPIEFADAVRTYLYDHDIEDVVAGLILKLLEKGKK